MLPLGEVALFQIGPQRVSLYSGHHPVHAQSLTRKPRRRSVRRSGGCLLALLLKTRELAVESSLLCFRCTLQSPDSSADAGSELSREPPSRDVELETARG